MGEAYGYILPEFQKMAVIAILYPMNHENIGPLKGTQSIREQGGKINAYRIEAIGEATTVTEIKPFVEKVVAEHGSLKIEDGEYVMGTHLCYNREEYEVWGRIDGFEDKVVTYCSRAGKEYEIKDSDTRILKFRVSGKIAEILKYVPLNSNLLIYANTPPLSSGGELTAFDHECLTLGTKDPEIFTAYKFANLTSIRIV
ncbi:hypothetical protein [Pseudomonas sp. S3E17]|uniref:hypothetical protein n=1 Tax=Pseudomonas sp. S3E17 TaxID=2817893 RepID=UPI00209F4BBC|nr:hypothetical protein [Pseudomonas sp. S3E17]MCP1462866.1 hypothetical protein [Pseudomonas sp. S3E17]